MQIAVLANDKQWSELRGSVNETVIERVSSLQAPGTFDAWIILQETGRTALQQMTKPVLLNSVTGTLQELKVAGNIIRINGWNGFLSRTIWEAAGKITGEVKQVFAALGKQFIEVKDEPGLIAARTVSMIINEAYFALGEEVSTRDEIDTAMKLGTNYPFGPFEWAKKIELGNIYHLLAALGKTDTRYLPAPLLIKEAAA